MNQKRTVKIGDVDFDLDKWDQQRAASMRFPPEFALICELELISEFVKKNGLDELKRLLGDVVFLHKERYYAGKGKGPLDGPYFNNVRQVASWCEDASKIIDEVLGAAWLIDPDHWDLIFTAARLSLRDDSVAMDLPALGGPNPLEGMDSSNLQDRLTATREFLGALSFAIRAGTGVRLPTAKQGRKSAPVVAGEKKRRRPPSPHVWPTFELMELWAKLTGTIVTEPKLGKQGKHNKVAIQDSAQFIFLALKMIDPRVTPENARTAIRRAREIDPETYGKPKQGKRSG